MSERHTYRGACHCGNLRVELRTAIAPEEIEVRVCQCSFCLRHRARAVTDPLGELALSAVDPEQLQRYRFGLSTAEFWICKTCGAYLAAVIDTPSGRRATLNINQLEDVDRFRRDPIAIDYAGESEEQRRARREKNWTPVVGD